MDLHAAQSINLKRKELDQYFSNVDLALSSTTFYQSPERLNDNSPPPTSQNKVVTQFIQSTPDNKANTAVTLTRLIYRGFLSYMFIHLL